ncbi:peptide ABC transporter [Corynebacterium poyangense]|uniref:Peptide ABC transporter n=1 Tax=Corynebacterium poyangense TaxID=2684405 RepID=A0A7H0SP50_9CORY|nr:ABC transporter substrate-binding protein [Corynebacterium poyangense]MBZ8177893.1 peptide ABC transporter [Corynebacterium poyangense]QNQ90325.1 peptide ABC transporter [Corynebacterium poyangense]
MWVRELSSRAGAIILSTLLALGLGACQALDNISNDADSDVVYLTHRAVLSTNAASAEGVSTDASLLSARIFPGAMISGPGGQLLPNTDVISAEAIPGPKLQVRYTINPAAVYSDGQPLNCEDYLLAFIAAVMPSLFGSHLPLYQHAESLDCEPGSKTFTVHFEEGYGQRWREFFGPGTVLPFHKIVERANVDTPTAVKALKSFDKATLAPIAEVWRHGFDVAHFDPELQVSFGPYHITAVTDSGDIHVEANPQYYGNPPKLDSLTFRPRNSEQASHNASAAIVGDVLDGNLDDFLGQDNTQPLEQKSVVGERTDTLTLASGGVFAEVTARRALAACIDNAAVAKASSDNAGVQVPPVNTRVVSQPDPLYPRISQAIAPEIPGYVQNHADLSGKTIRLAYHGPNKRYQAMVQALGESCKTQGITVEDVSTADTTLADLVDARNPEEGFVDAFLSPVDPQNNVDLEPADPGRQNEILKTEQALWKNIVTIPLAAEPRSFAIDHRIGNVVVYTGPAGIGWNMDRWQLKATP